jgi:2-hydroxychromene-2-carboxylate isomerase
MPVAKGALMPQISYYFSVVSVFTYLAGSRLETIAARHGADVMYRPIDIMALIRRTGGQLIAERHPNRQEYRLQDIGRTAAKLGLPIQLRPAFFPVNQAPASYAIIAAQAAGGGDLAGLVQSFPRAVWAEGRDISDDAVIGENLAAHGFDPKLAFSGMLTGAEAYAANLEDAVGQGVFGAPFYVADTGQRFWGQDRLDDLDLHLAGKF